MKRNKMSNTVRFYTNGLCSKFGFNDGDLLEDVIEDLNDGVFIPALNHRVLAAVVKEFVIPKLDQNVEIMEVETIHNPIRVSKINGVELTYNQGDPTLTPEYIDVSKDAIIKIVTRESHSMEDEADE